MFVDLICLAKLTSLSRDFDRESERYRSTSRSQSSKLLETHFVNHVVGRTFPAGRRPDRARREGRRREEEEYGYSPVRSQGKEFIFRLHLFGCLDMQKKGLKRSQLATCRLQVPRISRPPRSTRLTIQLPPSPLEVQKGDFGAEYNKTKPKLR